MNDDSIPAPSGESHRDRRRAARDGNPCGRRDALLFAVLAAFATACSPQVHLVGGGTGPVLGAPVKLTVGTVQADLSVVGDAAQILKEAAQDSFAAANMTCAGAACSVVDLHARISGPSASFAAATPPLRVIELVADYRAAGASRPTSTVSYQRTIAVPGNLSTATWMRISDDLTGDLAADFSFRSRKAGIVVRLPSWATRPTKLPSVSQPRAFHVAITSDGRADDDAIGSVGTHEVRLGRRATDYITEMITDDLRGAGHTIVPARDGRLVGSELEKFWIASVKGAAGWQTTAEIQVDLEVGPPPGIQRKKAERHSCSASEHSLQSPTEPDLARVLQKCLDDLARSIRNDSAWSMGQG